MIILKSDQYKESNEFINLSFNGTVVTVGLYIANEDADLSAGFNIENYTVTSQQSFDLSQIFRQYSKFTMMVDKLGNLSPIMDHDAICNSRNGLSCISLLKGYKEMPVLMIYFHENSTDYVLVSYLPTQTSETYTLRSVNEKFNSIILAYIPNAANVININKAKSNLLLKLDPNISLSGLEAQVDLLTQLVFLLLDAQTSAVQEQIETQLPKLNDFRSTCNTNCVTTVKSIEKCVAEISNVKGTIRQLQKEYYAVKEQNK